MVSIIPTSSLLTSYFETSRCEEIITVFYYRSLCVSETLIHLDLRKLSVQNSKSTTFIGRTFELFVFEEFVCDIGAKYIY